MKYVEILNAKRKAFEVALENAKTDLLLCEDQSKAFDNLDTFQEIKERLGVDEFFSLAGILNDRERSVKFDIKEIEKTLYIVKQELSLLKWI